MAHWRVLADVEVGGAGKVAPLQLHASAPRAGLAVAALRAGHDNDIVPAGLNVQGRPVEHRLHVVAAKWGQARFRPVVADGLAHRPRRVAVAPETANHPHGIRLGQQGRAARIFASRPHGFDHEVDGFPGMGQVFGPLLELADSD